MWTLRLRKVVIIAVPKAIANCLGEMTLRTFVDLCPQGISVSQLEGYY